MLGLDKNEIKDKRILDLGCGDGEFVKYCIENGITREAYGIDANLDVALVEDKFREHLGVANFTENLPVKEVDYMVSVGAVSLGVWAGEESMDMRRIIEKALASLGTGGEIRISPLEESAVATPLIGIEESHKKWDELLADISKTQGVECKIEPRNIKVIGNNNDIVLESVLVIKSIEKASERIFTKTEVMEIITRYAENATVVRELSDTQGLYLLEATVPGKELGEIIEYQYMRKGDHGNHNEARETGICVTDYKDGVPIHADMIAEYKSETGQWEEIK